ncbi:DivIVA domain-containing protein [Actinomarinicola tropica]|uniref:Cell wall synthesis protein Wag31 n=1 Tax=Actinomarinicola tropica TaxID=2789776 RepID=A0A5Q2RNS0_9ACTN|nr:DivIVA domain-containing protein [Actinomarinicola tropica]QGG95540.1 DivIVA domain-containing protein [Actinomarinicola tropica]
MDLTPELLRTVEFGEAKKGYDLDEVDEFLDRAATDLARQHTRLRELEQRVTEAEKRAAEAESSSRDRGDSDETLRRTLVLAQRTADAAIKEAQDEAARIVAEARQKADGMIASAEEQVRREVGATRDRLQAEIRDLEGRRGQLHDRIVELGAHLDAERDRLRHQVDQLRAAVEDESLRVAPVPGADPEPSGSEEPAVDLSAPMTSGATDDADGDDLEDLPPPPVGWDGPAADPAERELAEDDDRAAGTLFAPRAEDESVDLTDGGPPTQATPVVGADPDDVGSSHLDELRRAVSSEDPRAETHAEDDDAAMAAFFDQDDEEERTRRFGRRR